MISIEKIMPWLLMNFGLAMAMLAAIIFVFHIIINIFTRYTTTYEIIYSWMSLLAAGATGIYAFVMHVFFPVTAAAAIGWRTSPFQFEVGMANLGFGLVAILAFWGNYGFRVASVIGLTCWLWGDAIGHLYQMIIHHNYAVGNAGSWFWLDLLIPAVLILCIIKMRSVHD